MAPEEKQLTAAEIGQIGEKIVAKWLRDKGYTVSQNTKQPGSTDIEADGTSRKLLVQVKTAVSPNTLSGLTSDEERNIKSRAASLKRQAWLAQVTLNTDYTLKGSIAWTELKTDS